MDFATPKQEGSSIATTLEGALKQKYIKAVFATLIRNLPYNNILFSFFKEKIQQSALRYHLRKALEKSQDIESFKTNLQIRAEKANFNNATMQIIQNILKDTTQAIDEAREVAKTPTGVFTKAQEQETQQAKQTQLEQTQQAENKVFEVLPQEAQQLQTHFNFKGDKPLIREIRENEVSHALKSHGNEQTENKRGNIAITRADIYENYPAITQHHDEKFFTDKSVIYAKQVNGYHIGIEEALIGQDKLIFKSLWKTKGNYNREVLLRNAKASPYPQNADEAVKNDSISNPSLEQGNPLQSHPSNTHNLTTKDKIKQARELGLNAKEAVHYIKTNNLPQTRANTLPQGREILEAEIVETQEIPYSQKKLIEWIINKHPKLIGSNQQARLTTKELLEFIKEENLPAKEALKLIKNTPRNLPIKIDSTSKQTTQNVDSKQIQNSHNLHTLRENAKTTLAPLINKEITNINTQEVATLTNKGIRKMTSDKAIAKSVANGFEPAEHFKAVEQVTKLFEKATKATSYTDPTDTNLTIHRYNAPFENANALLTLKEYMQDGKRMYSLELENLDAIKFNPSGKDLMEQSPKSKDIDTANFNAPSENPTEIIPQKFGRNYRKLYKDFTIKSPQIAEFRNRVTLDHQLQYVPYGTELEMLTNPFERTTYFNPFYKSTKGNFAYVSEDGVIDDFQVVEKTDKYIIYDSFGIANIVDRESGLHLGKLYEYGKPLKLSNAIVLPSGLVEKWGITKKMLSFEEALKKAKNRVRGNIIDTTDRSYEPIRHILTRKTKDGVALKTLKIQKKSKIWEIEPTTGIHITQYPKLIENMDSKALKELLLSKYQLANPNYNDQKELLKLGINDKYLSPFQKELKEEILKDTQPPQSKKEFNADENSFEPLENLHNSPQGSGLKGDSVEAAKGETSGQTQGIKELESSAESTPKTETKALKAELELNKINTQNLNTKTTSKLSSQELKDLPIATQDEYKDFLQKIANKDYANTPEILKITTLNRDLQALINHNQSADVFITRARAGHISESRKGEYNQALSLEEQEQIPAVIIQAKEAYTGGGNGYLIPFNDTHNANKVNLIVLNSDEKGNFLITAKKINKSDFENPMYQKLARAGVEPATTTPQKEQKPTEAISPARDEIIPQSTQENKKRTNPNKYQILRATSDYVSLKKEVMYAKQSLQRRKADLQEAIKENNKERIQWAKGAIANIEKKIKSSQQDLNKEIQRIKKLGISLENPLNLKTTPMPNIKMQELQAIYKNVFPSLQSIDKAINSAKTQKEKDKLHKQRQHIINKFDKQMQALLKDFSQERQLLMRINLTTGRQEIQELESIHFDFENPFSVYNLDKTIYRQEWGKADGNYHQTQLVEARIFFDRFEPVIRQQIKSNINGVEDFSKGLIKDDDIFNLKTDVKNIREDIEILYNIKPLQEFGTNYAEHYHSGESAIQKLLTEAQAHKGKEPFKGQVAGAFYRKELGDIDLVWGEVTGSGKEAKGYGLAKIIEKHGDEFKDIGKELDEIIQDGEVVKRVGRDEAYNIEYKGFKVGINKGFNKQGENKWIVTAFDDNVEKTAKTAPANDSTKGASLPLNSSEIIPQTPQEIIKQAKEQGKSVTETKQLLQKHKELEAANNQKIKEFEKKLYQSDELARKMEYTSDSSGLSTKSYSHNENLERYFKDKFIDVDDFLTLKKLDKKSAEYKALLEKMYYKQQEQKANVKALGDLDSNVVAEQSQDYMQNYIKQIHNMSEQELINERKKLLTMPLHNDNMRLINAQMQQALESFMYPNMKYFTQNPTIYTFLRNGEKFDKRNGAKKLSLQEFDTYRKMLEQDLNLTPVKEFGANYAEYYRDGVGAIQKLISEAQAHKQSGAKTEYKGQVAGAFYRDDIGDITLAWGEKGTGKSDGWGLAKIAEYHPEVLHKLDKLIQDLPIVKETENRYKLDNGDFFISIRKDFEGQKQNWVLTALERDESIARRRTDLPSSQSEAEKTTSANATAIIPQTQISNIKKQLVELKKSKSAYEKDLKDLERNMKDVEVEERYSRGEERIKVFEQKRLIQSSIDEHTQGLNAVLKKMIELYKQLPENVRYTKEVLDDLTKIEAILKGSDYSLKQALSLSKITKRLQEKAIIESESFLNKVYKLDDFAKGAKSLQGTSYAYNTDESIKRYFKTIAEMIDFIPAFKKISANQPETLPTSQTPKVDSTPTTLNTQEAKELLESKQGERLPKELDIQGFLKSLDSVKNKQNFIAHLHKKDDAQSRLAYLHIVEPTLKTPDLELTKGGRKTKIKVFNDGENFYSFLIADLADKTLFTFLPKARKGYIQTKIKNADLIQTFTSQASKDQEPNGLAREIIPQQSKSIKEEEIKEFLKNNGEQINSNYPQETATLILQQNKDNGIVLSGFEIKGKDYAPQLEVLEFKSKKAQREFETLMKSYDTKGDFLKFEKMPVFKPNDEAFLQYLKKYKDDKNAKLALAYNLSKDLIRRQGGGRLEVFMTNFLRQIHILENQNSTIYQSNPHIGAGVLGGSGAEKTTSANASEIIPQQKIKFAMEKFNYDEKKAKDLLEWHKDSDPLTKDERDLPRVFYHGSGARFQVFKKEFDEGKTGFWFADRKIIAEDFAKDKGGKAIYPVFLKMKNPIWLTYQKEGDKWVFDWLDEEGKTLLKEAKNQGLSIDYFQKDFKFKEFLQSKGYDGIVLKTKINGNLQHSVFDSNQIKHIDNKGVDGKYFNESNPNIYQSDAHLGSGLLGGSVAGIQQDENGNLTFDPAKFVLGFLGGAAGSKAVAKGFKYLKENPQVKEAVVKELADTLALGFEKAREKYPLLSLLEPRYMVQNQRGRSIQAKSMLKEAQEKALKQEREAIEKVLSGSTQKAEILKDLDNADEILAVILKGYQKGQKGKGAEHIRLEHTLDTTQEGYLTQNEVLNMGVKMREFIEKYGEPFIETNDKGMKSRIYEWEENNTRFRIVAGIRAKEGNIAPFPLADEIITFYSDRNLKEAMQFKNPILKVQEKFKFNPQKARDLLEWHKDSHPLTKDKNGLPKVFYHGSKTKGFQVFRDYESGWGTFLSTHKKKRSFTKTHKKAH